MSIPRRLVHLSSFQDHSEDSCIGYINGLVNNILQIEASFESDSKCFSIVDRSFRYKCAVLGAIFAVDIKPIDVISIDFETIMRAKSIISISKHVFLSQDNQLFPLSTNISAVMNENECFDISLFASTDGKSYDFNSFLRDLTLNMDSYGCNDSVSLCFFAFQYEILVAFKNWLQQLFEIEVTILISSKDLLTFANISNEYARVDIHPSSRHLALFILAGQSNMAGRPMLTTEYMNTDKFRLHYFSDYTQGVEQSKPYLYHNPVSTIVVSEEDGELKSVYRDHVHFFDPKEGWKPSELNLHCNVDIAKVPGLGPGVSFACRYIDDLNKESREYSTSVGLIPVAAGATAIDHWRASYYPDIIDQYGSLQSESNTQYHCKAQTMSLQSCALRSLYLSIQHKCEDIALDSVRLEGILWYQGENDTANEEMSNSYTNKLMEFVTEFRRNIAVIESYIYYKYHFKRHSFSIEALPILHILRPIPWLQMYITFTRPWILKGLKEWRKHNETLAKSLLIELSHEQVDQDANMGRIMRIHNPFSLIGVLDAFGCELLTDRIHLSIPSNIHLGELMYASMKRLRHLVESLPVTFKPSTDTACTSNPKHLSYHNIAYATLGGDLNVPVVSTALQDDLVIVLQELYSQSRFQALEYLSSNEGVTRDSLTNLVYESDRPETSLHHNQLQSDITSKYVNPRQLGLKAANFTYGEMTFEGCLTCLSGAAMTLEDNKIVDLGCGSGILLAAAMAYRILLQRFSLSNIHDSSDFNIVGIDLMRTKWQESVEITKRYQQSVNALALPSHNCNFRIACDNILTTEWTDASIVFVCATCFQPDVLLPLAQKFRELKSGSRVIVIDNQFMQEKEYHNDMFSIMSSCQIKTSWGEACVYVYVKQ